MTRRPRPLDERGSMFRSDVLDGLSRDPKSIPCKYLYDARGSALFDVICGVDAYYPTKIEREILETNADEISSLLREASCLVELGSGASEKTCTLLDRIEHLEAYVPVDISRSSLDAAAARLKARYPGLRIEPVCADYTDDAFLPAPVFASERPDLVIFFPGSTIGNFVPDEARAFLSRMRSIAGARGAMLLGVDTVKSPRILDRAYNDPEGATAAFNLNVLERINAELDGTFDVAGFCHEARFVPELGRVEMHLRSRRRQTVRIGPSEVQFEAGEVIVTEYSYKYGGDLFDVLARSAGFRTRRVWTDPRGMFGVHYLTPAP